MCMFIYYIKKQAPFSSVPAFIYMLNRSPRSFPLERVISLLTC